MAMQLEKVVPFGRSIDEYRAMFALSSEDLDQAIIGVGDGPASFNAEMAALRRSVVSVDPLYASPAREIERQFYAVVDGVIDQVKTTPNDRSWALGHWRLRQNGSGSVLVRAGFEQCKHLGFEAVVVLGNPAYYRRFGFTPAARCGIWSEYDVPEETFMVVELRSGCLYGAAGRVSYHAAFNNVTRRAPQFSALWI